MPNSYTYTQIEILQTKNHDLGFDIRKWPGNLLSVCLFTLMLSIPGPVQAVEPNFDDRYIWIEAEEGQVYAPAYIGDCPTCSGKKYVEYNSPLGGMVTFSFTISEPGDYYIWGHVYAAGNTTNAFDVEVRDGNNVGLGAFTWDYPSANDAWVTSEGLWEKWVWDALTTRADGESASKKHYLAPGNYTLNIAKNEPHTKLDKILITNNANYKPNEVMAGSLFAGVGKKGINTPIPSTELYGHSVSRTAQYCHAHDTSSHCSDEISATVLTLKQDTTQTAILTLDITSIDKGGADTLKSIIANILGISTNNVFISSSHNHSAPKVFQWNIGSRDQAYWDSIIVPAVTAATNAAMADLRPVQVAVCTIDSDVATSRRHYNVSTGVLSDLVTNSQGNFDPEMTVISFIDQGTAHATIIHYGAHATAAGLENKVSRDWPGYMMSRFEGVVGGTALFINGALGDVGPSLENSTSTIGSSNHDNDVEALGLKAGNHAIEAFQSIEDYGDFDLEVFTDSLAFPLQDAGVSEESYQNSISTYLWIEAEQAQIYSPAYIGDCPICSGNKYVEYNSPVGGMVQFSFNISEPGDYYIWGHVYAPGNTTNAFDIEIRDANNAGYGAFTWDYPSANDAWVTSEGLWGTWVWDAVTTRADGESAPKKHYLTPGNYKLNIAKNEPHTKLDKILITNNENYNPGEKYTWSKDILYNHNVLRMGPVVLIPFFGEPFAEIVQRIKKRSPFKHTLSASVTSSNHSYLGYIPTKDAWQNKKSDNTSRGYASESAADRLWDLQIEYERIDDILVEENLRILSSMSNQQ